MNTLHSYSIARPFGGMNIPIAIQSLYMRDYCARNNYVFKLPIVEWCINVYENLGFMLQQDNITDIGMTSILFFRSEILSFHFLFRMQHKNFSFPVESHY